MEMLAHSPSSLPSLLQLGLVDVLLLLEQRIHLGLSVVAAVLVGILLRCFEARDLALEALDSDLQVPGVVLELRLNALHVGLCLVEPLRNRLLLSPVSVSALDLELLNFFPEPHDQRVVFPDPSPLALRLVLELLPLGLVDPDGLALPLLLLLLLRLLNVAREVGGDVDPALEPVHLPPDLGQVLVEDAVHLLCIVLRQLVGQVLEPDPHLGVPLRNPSPDIPAGLDVGGFGEPLHADDTLLTDEAEVLPVLGADGLGHALLVLG